MSTATRLAHAGGDSFWSWSSGLTPGAISRRSLQGSGSLTHYPLQVVVLTQYRPPGLVDRVRKRLMRR